MSFPARALILGITLFAATNIDDTFVLLGFFADPKYRAHRVVIGQYLGIATLVAISLLAALIALVIPPAYVGLLGLLPIAIGSRKLGDLSGGRDKGEEELERHPASAARGQVLAVAAVTIANGGDNIGVYTPVFAVRSGIETAVIIAVFVLMTAMSYRSSIRAFLRSGLNPSFSQNRTPPKLPLGPQVSTFARANTASMSSGSSRSAR